MRIVCISDTHSLHRRITVPEGDILVHAGDLTRTGTLEELRDVNNWLAELPHPHKIIIAGNHDRICEEVPELVPDLLSSATYLCNSIIAVDGYTFFGSPMTLGLGEWAFSRPERTLARLWAGIPRAVDVLVTHGPPLGGLDQSYRSVHLGSPSLAHAVLRLRPLLHIFGHVHEAYGVEEAHGVTLINASICTLKYTPANAPIVWELP